MVDRMLNGIDDIDWASLEHAYGPATDVPGQIRALIGDDDEKIERAIWELFGNIHHQGTVYPASAPAVPYLVEALGHMRPKHQSSVLDLLGALAEGHGYWDVHQHLSLSKSIIEADDFDLEGTVEKERGAVQSATLAVFALWDDITPYLSSEDEELRLSALGLLTTLGACDVGDQSEGHPGEAFKGVRPAGSKAGEWAARITAHIEAELSALPHTALRGAFLRSLLKLGQLEHSELSLDMFPAASPVEQFVIMRAQMAREGGSSEHVSASLADAIAALSDGHEGLTTAFDAIEWPFDDWPQQSLFTGFTRMSSDDLERHAAACAALISAQGGSFFEVEKLVLYLAVGHPPPNIPDDPCTLSPGRREITNALLELPEPMVAFGLWVKSNGNASYAFSDFGVTRDREAWLVWLDGEAYTPTTSDPKIASKPPTKKGWFGWGFGPF